MVRSKDTAEVAVKQKRGPRGEGSVGFERGRYIARQPLGNGKRVTFASRLKSEGGTKEEALAKRRLWRSEWLDPKTGKVKPEYFSAEAPAVDDSPVYTVASWGEYWLEQLVKPAVAAGRRSPLTYDTYRWAFSHVASRKIGKVKLADLGRPHVVLFWDEITAQGLGLAARDKVRNVLATALEAAVDRGHLAANFAKAFKPDEKYVAADKPAPDLDAARAIRAVAAQDTDPRYQIVLELGWRLGLRRQEIAALRFSDFDLERNELRIGRRLQRPKGQGLIVRGGVKMGDEASFKTKSLGRGPWAQLLQRQRRLNLEWAILHQRTWGKRPMAYGPAPLAQAEDAFILPNMYGNPTDSRQIAERLKAWAVEAGYPEYHLHQLRHDFVSVLLNSGMALWDVAQAAGHSDTKVTERVYGHRSNQRMHEVSGVSDAWLDQDAAASVATGTGD